MAGSSTKRFPLYAKDYELFEEVGEGVSASVYRARCIALNENVAIKIMDLEKCRNDLDTIRKEVHIMSLIEHPNLLKAHCSFIDRNTLWIVMPYMSGGSCFHLMKTVYPQGFEQPIIATLLREVLKALVYLHRQGHIHRDVKAGNILLHSRGVVKLGDFGVSACMFDSGERMRTRSTFVGTPCWMAPEVMQQVDGYDFKADIWSFGITALELAHGHAPFSKYPPMKVLLMTLQNAPPRLDYDRDKKFSKSFRELIAACLVKDPKKRPTAAKLLKHPFFKHARSTDYLSRKILHGLSPLGERFKKLKEAEAELFKGINGEKEHEYMRGISAWNFDLQDLRKQASLVSKNPDNEMCSSESQVVGVDVPKRNPMIQRSKTMSLEMFKISDKDLMSASNSLTIGPLLPSFRRKFLPAIGYKVGILSDESNACRQRAAEALALEEPNQLELLAVDTKQTPALEELHQLEEPLAVETKQTPALEESHQVEPLAEKPKNGYTVSSVSRCAANEVLPLLQSLLVQNDIQREKVIRLIRFFDGTVSETQNPTSKNEAVQIYPSREKELQSQVNFLEQSVEILVEEVKRRKEINDQLEEQIRSLTSSSSRRSNSRSGA
ncbi:PREDICTED: serine/threonine-protein kinase BLUS1 isoform X1 [Brassica oleracea var. oleracea]|uniref:serine/threonine-protein kinase BLUS1 isoform X1 n=1 Tax=Brassica oleracea var. oleracea TaxID=109376 RepID=UPI0006A70F80|nr:PREDICTED: serine/threonine-protein kinase BLUS1 isoform X1 [Brassica oleracea var. oleracea]XP_013618958.1 PREDICTED: serine/threonine-protein kinase BLUS1 isoform X1 [Brassica oleracea var. oleracea]